MIIIDLNKSFKVETNIFNFVFKRQFIQRDEKERLYFITFFLKKLYRLKFNYPIYNKELIVIIESFNEWKLYFNNIKYQMKIYIDYKNLIYFTIFKEFN